MSPSARGHVGMSQIPTYNTIYIELLSICLLSVKKLPKRISRTLYRSHELLHFVAVESTYSVMPGLFFFGNLIVITCFFCFIHNFHGESTFVLVSTSIVGLVALVLIFLTISFELQVTSSVASLFVTFRTSIFVGSIK